MNLQILFIAKAGFALLTIVFAFLFFREIQCGIIKTNWREAKKLRVRNLLAIVLVGWLIVVSIWSASGIMSKFSIFPLNFMPVLLIPLVTIVGFMFTSGLNEILANIPMENIIRLQVFRVFVEILLWLLFVANALPVQMTFEGMNFDVLSGLTAPFIAWFVSRGKLSGPWITVWNVMCLLLLINIVSIALMSTPTPLRTFMNEPANTIVAEFPVSWLPGFLVPFAYCLNLFSIKQVALQRKGAVVSHTRAKAL